MRIVRIARAATLAVSGVFVAFGPAVAPAANVFQTDLASVTVFGPSGVLRAGSPWIPSPPPAGVGTLFDGVFLPANTQWNLGTFWWDELASPVALVPTTIELQLNSAHTVDRFVLQGDDNESYAVDWWDGSGWQLAYAAGPVNTFGMETRDSGVTAAVTADRFRVRGFGGDSYYSLAEVQAFDRLPEPASMLLALLGLGGVGLARRRNRYDRSAAAAREVIARRAAAAKRLHPLPAERDAA